MFKIDKRNIHNLDENKKVSTCPLCSPTRKKKTDKCMMLDWGRGLGTCQHCSEVIQLHSYISDKEKVYEKPTSINSTQLSDKLVKWFSGRGISQNTLVKMKLSEGVEWMPQIKKEINTIQFNYFQHGEIINVKYRDGAKNFKLFKGAEKIFYNLDGILNTKEAVIVEGEIDALSFIEASVDNVVSVPNGATLGNVNLDYLDNCIDYFEDKEKVYLCTDNDEAGINLRNELIRRLGSEKCYLVDFNGCKDPNEYLVKYGSIALAQTLADADQVPIDGVVTLKDFKEDLRDFYLKGSPKGSTINVKDFDNIFSTYTSQFIVVTGIPSSGKSDFVDQMAIGYAMSYGWKTFYCSPENAPHTTHADKIIRKLSGYRPNNLQQLSTLGWKKCEEFIENHFTFCDYESSVSLESTLEKAAELVKRKGIKCLVIDPYNKVRLKGSLNKSTTEYTNDYLNLIDQFAKKHDILIILVAHPRKPSTGETLNYKPSFYDIKGGGEFYDMSPHGLLVHRDYVNNLVEVKVLKVKFSHLGENSASCMLKWCSGSGRYVGAEEEEDRSNWMINKEKEIKQLIPMNSLRLQAEDEFDIF